MAMQIDAVQQELLDQFVSPVIHADRRVTFRLKAPAAREVLVQGIAGLAAQAMRRDEKGFWHVTVGPLAPELYSYVYEVDGAIVTDPQNRNVKKWLSVNSVFEVPGDPPLVHQRRVVPHGVVHHHVCPSRAAGAERGVYVYTPPGYDGDPRRCYPLVVLLHGYGDDESAWLEVGRAHHIADNLLADERMEPMVIAMPYGHALPIELGVPFDDYADRNLVAMEADVVQDLVPMLNEHYRLRPSCEHRAIAGLSMGGGQALTIGLKHLDQFAWIAGFSSAAPRVLQEQQFAELFTDATVTNQHARLLWLGCGDEDFLLERNRRFVGWLSDQAVGHVYRETAGGHDWSVWRKYLAELLPLLFRAESDEMR